MKLRLAIVGCGQISAEYGKDILRHGDALELMGATDLQQSKVEDFCGRYGGRVYKTVDAILADREVDVVVDLAIHHAHFDLNRRALLAGKHVFTEKPMSLTYAEAVELVAIAKKSGMRLCAAPVSFLGEATQTAARFLQTDLLGPLRLVYAEVNWAQIEKWIGSPALYFTVGPLRDVGVYAITAMVFLLGGVKRVWGYSATLKTPRYTSTGEPFPVTAPDFTTGVLEFRSGVIARLTANYYCGGAFAEEGLGHLRGLEFHGDRGAFTVGWAGYCLCDAPCRYCREGEKPFEVPLLRSPAEPNDRALGLVDLAEAIRDNRPHRCSAEQAAHVIEIMEGLQTSSEQCRFVDVHSDFQAASILPWARDAKLMLPGEETD